MKILITVLAALVLLPRPGNAEDASPIRVDVKVYRLHNGAEWPVPSDVTLVSTGETKRATDGKTFFFLPRCDESIAFEADPVMSYLSKVRATCKGPPVPLEVRQLYAGQLFDVLDDPGGIPAALESRPSLARALDQTGQRAALDDLVAAMRDDNLAQAARIANDLSWSLRKTSPGAAQSLSVIAMDSGYRAIGIDPASDAAPLIAYDAAQGLHVMTDLGREVIDSFAAAAAVQTSEPWTPELFEAIQTETPRQRTQPLVVPQSGTDIRNLRIHRYDGSLDLLLP